MHLSWLDHLLALVLALIFPLWATRSYGRFRRDVAERGGAARLREYRLTVLIQWSLSAATLLLWYGMRRPWGDLGLALPASIGSVVGAAVTALGLAFLAMQWRQITQLGPEGLAALRAQVADVQELMPRTETEQRAFRLLALTAGICEELLFRGYLIAYASAFLPIWPASLLVGVAFGLAHAYQGPVGIVKTGVIGILAGCLYVGTGSLLWPMVLHTAIDLQGGAAGRRILGDASPAPASS